jgi:hypothetical protein
MPYHKTASPKVPTRQNRNIHIETAVSRGYLEFTKNAVIDNEKLVSLLLDSVDRATAEKSL